jgi:N-acyl-D-aspartate/D-glutamate deacylase
VLSHQKACGRRNHGRSAELVRIYEDEGRDVDLAIDAYPYVAGSTVLDPALAAVSSRVVVTSSRPMPHAAGRDLAAIARDLGVSEAEAIARLLPAGAVYFHMAEADVARLLAWPRCMVGSDGLPHDAHPHPRLWGAFPRVLRAAHDAGGLPGLAEAVRKMTSLPASVFGLERRGLVRPGFAADLVFFDPARVRDAATFEQPRRPAEGIAGVWVDGVATDAGRGGRFLARATA